MRKRCDSPAVGALTTRRDFSRHLCCRLPAAAALLSFGGCRSWRPRRELKIAYVNWADATALTYLASAVLETHLGYRVELTMADAAPVFTSVADGGHDLFLNAWLPVTHAAYYTRFRDSLEDLGPNFTGTRIGLVVPDYVDTTSIAGLASQAAMYDRQIIGIDAGAGIMAATEDAIRIYGLEMRLIPSSEAAMTAALKEAIDRGRPIIVTGWRPHWKFSRWKLRFLEDPKSAYPATEDIHTVARPGFSEEHPAATKFLQQFHLDENQLQDLMDQLRQPGASPGVVSRTWIRAHQPVLEQWLDGVPAAPGGGAA